MCMSLRNGNESYISCTGLKLFIPDLHYYLAQQIHPVVSRLCTPIEETDAVRLAEALECRISRECCGPAFPIVTIRGFFVLGMDASSYRRSAAARASDNAAVEDEWAWNGPVTYDHCESLSFVCPGQGCGNVLNIRKAIENEESGLRLSLDTCEKCNVELSQYSAYICNRLSLTLRDYVMKHLMAPFKCDDPVCEFSTRTHLLRWSREGLECPKCSGGVLRKEYSAKDLFDQQMFLKQVVDVHTALEELKPEQRRILQSKPNFPAVMSLYNELSALITRYLDKNAYSKVDLAFIFAPMLKIE
ncbi:unnamed protein product [Haemonchus placei]|uniref:DNA-directed DNA polymerase n=1 Tax=Haemonchus placei TaxID=6290 RepID=A0A0N4X2H8_HAEPC|nr:unnamed protein product [Haemonchus placei]